MANPHHRTPPIRPSGAPDPADGAASAASSDLAAARERSIRVLTDRYGDGTVDDDEFEERLARLRQASDTAAMEAVVAGLAEMSPEPPPRRGWAYDVGRRVPPLASHPGAPRPAPSPPPPSPEVTLPRGERRILAVFNEMRRSGWWEVPRFLRVRAVAADLKLDLRDTTIPEGCTFDVGAYMAAVTIIVRPGTTVDFDVLPMLGSAVNKAPSSGPVPHLRVTGTALMAEVKVIVREPGERKKRRATSWWGGSP